MEHTRKQLKYILAGGTITWFTAVLSEIQILLYDSKRTARICTQVSMLLGSTTILIFLYLVLLPRVRGVNPTYSNWRDSPELALIIPVRSFTKSLLLNLSTNLWLFWEMLQVLTTSIVAGWSFLSFTLSTWSSLGALWSLGGSSGLYALSFGLIGLIPVPDR